MPARLSPIWRPREAAPPAMSRPAPYHPPMQLARFSRLRTGAALLALGGVLQWTAARGPAAVERLFSRGLYRFVPSRLGCVAGLVPFSVAEAAVLAAGAAFLVLA